jgi:hypothetical protein
MRKNFLLVSVMTLFLGLCATAVALNVDILGMKVPVPAGFILVSRGQDKSINAQVATYQGNLSVGEAVTFYKTFLEGNGFLVLGGEQPDGSFDASVKKDAVQFSLRIFSLKRMTVVQFIW